MTTKVIMAIKRDCFWCKKSVLSTALINLVHTWEPFIVDDDSQAEELREVPWHKECYNAAQHRLHMDAATPYCKCEHPSFAPFIECENCGKPPRQ